MEQKDKRATTSMYFSNQGSVLTRRIAGVEQVSVFFYSPMYLYVKLL